jgi:UDP-N-acetylmuramoyl-tripeptide--D-alanyl-D-alanine ligase
MRNTPLTCLAKLIGLECESVAQPTGYQVDSRRIEPGELFFALPGEKVDGHQFLGQVAERGGVGAVVSKGYTGPDFGLVLLRVDDVLVALQAMAKHFVSVFRGQIVGITGSMGKTTTKDFTAKLLEGKFRVGKTYSSYNTRLTLPITVLNMKGDEEVWVLEMGMGEPGDIAKLVEIAPPDVAVITKIGMAHYGPLSLEEVARAKGEIFGNPKTKKAIFPHGLEFDVGCERLTFSLFERSADYFLSQGVIDERGVRASKFEIPFPQPHVQHNFLAAVAVARALKMGWDEIEAQVPKLQLPKMRFEQLEKNGVVYINDAYNANPESMMAALACLPEPKPGGKKIAVLGRMISLGHYSKSSHEEVGRCALNHVDILLTLADEAKPLYEVFSDGRKLAEHFDKLAPMKQRLKELVRAGDVVLVKGSRDLAMERILDE